MNRLRQLAWLHLCYALLMVMVFLITLLHAKYGPTINSFPAANLSASRVFLLLLYFSLSALSNGLSAYYLRAGRSGRFSEIVAWTNCLAFPMGTVLGVFTLRSLRNHRFMKENLDAASR
jgi:hypothetical protein